MKTKWDYTELAEAYLKRPDYSASAIQKISLLGDGAALEFSQSDEGLTVSLPDNPPGEHANVLKLEFA